MCWNGKEWLLRMDRIIELIGQIREKEPDWEKKFADESYQLRMRSDLNCDETMEMINNLMGMIRDKQIGLADREASEDSLWEELQGSGISGETVETIKRNNRMWISRYKSLTPVRKLGDGAIKLLIDIFENISAYYNPRFLHKGEEYGIDDEAGFVNAVLQIDQIVSRHIQRHYDKKTARIEFMAMSGLEEKYGLVYGELYEKNMLNIQNNLLHDKITELSRKTDRILEILKSKQFVVRSDENTVQD